MTVTSIEPPTEDATSSELPAGPFILSCPYCSWTSLDIGIKFEKHNNITVQLQKIYNPTQRNPLSPIERSGDEGSVKSPLSPGSATELPKPRPPDNAELFSRLHGFYKTQIAESSDSGPGFGLADLNYNSPSSISRLLNLYSSAGKKAGKRQKPHPMREALSLEEGLRVLQSSSEDAAIQRLQDEGWSNTASTAQQHNQTLKQDVRFISDLRPIATLLRTKRSKRCRACRTLLSRPEPKVSSTRYKIKVLALNNIPRVSIRSLQSLSSSTTAPTSPTTATFNYEKLQPLLPQQFLLTLTNPLFDPIRVTLATPATTPGRVQSRVTILCPQFDVGANTDVWDDALNSSTTKRKSMLGGYGIGTTPSGSGEAEQKQAEAGKVWERGRNWTSVIVEVVPGLLPGSTGSMAKKSEGDGVDEEDDGLEEDVDVLEIPVFVRIEYETEAQGAEEKLKDREGKEKREVAFWCVLGVGRITS